MVIIPASEHSLIYFHIIFDHKGILTVKITISLQEDFSGGGVMQDYFESDAGNCMNQIFSCT